MSAEALAAWVQALASIVGIALAFFFPWKALQTDRAAFKAEQEQRQQDRNERLREREEEKQSKDRERLFLRRKFARPAISNLNKQIRNIMMQKSKLSESCKDLRESEPIHDIGVALYTAEYRVVSLKIVDEIPTEASLFEEQTWSLFFEISHEISKYNSFIDRLPSWNADAARELEAALDGIIANLKLLRNRLASEAGISK